MEKVAISLQEVKNYVGENIAPLQSLSHTINSDHNKIINEIIRQAQTNAELEKTILQSKEFLLNTINEKFQSLKAEQAINRLNNSSLSQAN